MKAEILAPAGDEQTAYAALNAGADAIYLGLKKFSAREGAENFGGDALSRVIRFAHLLGAKVYVALNTLVKDSETADFFASVREAWERGADAILIQDIFLGKLVKEKWPEIVLHLSTQGGCSNVYGAEVAREYGFSRVVLARETPISEIKRISKVIETEAFVQGALCTCYSGQCYMSSFAGNNSGNRGRCKQPCRKLYSIDREGYEEPAYALSLSDLSVGERVKELLDAGVVSLKIEGRMRRPAYCAAAVKYVKSCIPRPPAPLPKEGACASSAHPEPFCANPELFCAHPERSEGSHRPTDFVQGDSSVAALPQNERTKGSLFSDLKRAYNRGNYTQGLAFGQDKTLLSRNVQGHIGEEVGKVAFVRGRPFCESEFSPQKGDGFKILRNGREVAGANFAEAGKGGFFLHSDARLARGDTVCVTTDTASSERVLSGEKKREITLYVSFFAGQRPMISCDELDFDFIGSPRLEAARNAPLTEEEVAACFNKTDGMPLSPRVTFETDGVFLQKSALNALRRNFYAALSDAFDPPRILKEAAFEEPVLPPLKTKKTALIARKTGNADVNIVKPDDYSALPAGGENVFLYLPPLFTGEDERLVAPHFKEYAGVYCEGYYGIALAKKYGLKLFAGTGFNLTNRFAVDGVKSAGAEYFALSKEISWGEQRALAAEGAFALTKGAIKVMDLCYCPFEKTCLSCDKREIYILTDEDGRRFPLRRYWLGGCRFEVYNCAPLDCEAGANPLFDETVKAEGTPTRGHAQRSMV